MGRRGFALGAGLCAALLGCSSVPVTVAPELPERYEVLGSASGTACGSMLILDVAYNFIPILLNSRVQRAYARALESVPGATALRNPTLDEYWYWWIIGTARCTTIRGDAVR